MNAIVRGLEYGRASGFRVLRWGALTLGVAVAALSLVDSPLREPIRETILQATPWVQSSRMTCMCQSHAEPEPWFAAR